jgi:hypothetical protein
MKTIWGVKDYVVVQEDLKECGIWPRLWLQPIVGAFFKPIVSYVLSNEEKDRFLQIITDMKTPTGYVSSLRKRISKDGDLKGMKSHDYHIMMHEILHVYMCHLMEKGCKTTIICLWRVF